MGGDDVKVGMELGAPFTYWLLCIQIAMVISDVEMRGVTCPNEEKPSRALEGRCSSTDLNDELNSAG
jgi:hypothetical protein